MDERNNIGALSTVKFENSLSGRHVWRHDLIVNRRIEAE